jgi:hypothetical protein
MSTGLTTEETEQLASLLEKIAHQQGLAPRVHPGYKDLRPPAATISANKRRPPQP